MYEFAAGVVQREPPGRPTKMQRGRVRCGCWLCESGSGVIALEKDARGRLYSLLLAAVHFSAPTAVHGFSRLTASPSTVLATMDPRELATIGESTPRARKSVRTGFTPVRNTTSRPTVTVNAAQRSPERRHMAAMHISDVTNSPRGSAAHVRATTEPAAAASKGGKWVNRLKSSTNGAPAARTVSTMRSFFEKGS